MDDDTTPSAEEMAGIRTELEAARTDIERLERAATEARLREAGAIAAADTLRAELAAANDAATAYDSDARALREQLEASDAAARQAAERYRDLLLRAEPMLPPDLVTGDSIAAIDAAAEAARTLAGRVRAHIDAQAQAGRVPAGAPARSAPDTAGMTPEQKIRHGLAQRAG